ncbi:MAG: hypothetical protein R2766_13110 [Saprospiraceae bacterium]
MFEYISNKFMIKFSIHTLVFYSLDMLKLMVANTGQYVDKIYLSHSKMPWSVYNKNAAKLYCTSIDSSLIDDFPFKDKIVWLEGNWSSEEDQRNHSLERARSDGMDYMIIQDADEFYQPEEFIKNLKAIEANPNYPVYRCSWSVFWKSVDYVIQVRDHQGKKGAVITTCPNFAVNTRINDVKFINRRLINRMKDAYMLPGLCLHLAWVLSDDEVLQKIQTWGHSNQFDYLKWYRQKWLAWTPQSKYIGHITRANYLGAVPFAGDLPKELKSLPYKNQSLIELGLIEKLDSWLLDIFSIMHVKFRVLIRKIII